MSDSSTPELCSPEQRRRNRNLGWILAAVVIGIIVAFMALFTWRGLPKNPEVAERLRRERSAQAEAPAVAPTTPPIGADDKASNVAPAQESAR